MADMFDWLQGLLTAVAPLAGSFTPRPYPGMPGGNAFAGPPQLAQAGPPGMQAGTGSPQPGAASWMQPMPQQSGTSVNLQELSRLLRDAGIGPQAGSPSSQADLEAWLRGLPTLMATGRYGLPQPVLGWRPFGSEGGRP